MTAERAKRSAQIYSGHVMLLTFRPEYLTGGEVLAGNGSCIRSFTLLETREFPGSERPLWMGIAAVTCNSSTGNARSDIEAAIRRGLGQGIGDPDEVIVACLPGHRLTVAQDTAAVPSPATAPDVPYFLRHPILRSEETAS
jgi:hypothetical protein